MDAEHPPIPPNSKHFDPLRYPYFTLECGEEICLIKTARWRPIIAAVARVAWMEEVERLRKTTVWGLQKAHDNAEAWAAWSKQ